MNLYILIGPKGAGKTHIGRLAAMHTEIDFIAVETIWLARRPDEDGWRKVEEQIAERFATHNRVMIESPGAGEAFQAFYERLAAYY